MSEAVKFDRNATFVFANYANSILVFFIGKFFIHAYLIWKVEMYTLPPRALDLHNLRL